MSGYYIYFGDRQEYLDEGDGKILHYPIGHLVFAFLDVDWGGLTSLTAQQMADEKIPFAGSGLEREMLATCDECIREMVIRPLSVATIDLYTPEAVLSRKFLVQAHERLTTLEDQKQLLLRLVEKVLDMDGPHHELSIVQRYYLYRQTNREIMDKLAMYYQGVSVQSRVSEEGRADYSLVMQEEAEAQINKIKAMDLHVYTMHCCQSLYPLILLEAEYMCAQELRVRRCANCGRYFLPFSSKARYCDRILPEKGKACKDFAALQGYQERIDTDEAKKYYLRVHNTYRMRVQRDPERYTAEEYAAWVKTAHRALEEYRQGGIELDRFKAQIGLPE